jgi:small nuclear ribonucleoprotein (snRNP)-like protein
MAMPLRRIRIEPVDVERDIPFKREDLSGQEVTIRMEDGTEVQGHAFRADYEHTKGDYTERLGGRYNSIDVEVDETQANLLAAAERGEPVYVRFPDGTEVQGHIRS